MNQRLHQGLCHRWAIRCAIKAIGARSSNCICATKGGCAHAHTGVTSD